MKKYLLALALLTGLLTACGGSSTDTGDGSTSNADTPRYVSYKSSDFIIEVPDAWNTVSDFTDDYPSSLRVAFKNNVKNATFTANLTVIREENPNELTSADISQKKLQNHDEHLLGYKLISQEDLTLSVNGADSATWLNTFEGKDSVDSPTLQFMQVALAKGDRAWIVTATYLPDEDEFTVEKLQHMLNSFEVR